MKKLFTLLLIIPILGFSQNDLVFNKVRNILLAAGQTATVPAGKVWKVESALPALIYLVHDGDDDFGISSDGGNIFAALTVTGANASGGNAIWIEEGNTIKPGSSLSTQSLSILEFNVVAISSGSSGSGSSGGGDTGDSGNSNNNDDNGFNNSTSPGTYDGSQTTFSSYGDDFTDVEGNTYSTAIIGDLVWTITNADHSNYRDGTPIPHITDLDEWNTTTTGAYTYLNQDESLGYGKIYNWYAIIGKHDNDQSTENKVFAPIGWRVPTRTNWESTISIFNFITGGSSQSAIGTWYAFKSTTGWLTYNGNNHSKLNMKPNGYISAWNTSYYGFNDLNIITGGTSQAGLINEYGSKFWTSTLDWQFPTNKAYAFEIYDTDDYGSRYQLASSYFQPVNGVGYTNSGNYVRLVKDAN